MTLGVKLDGWVLLSELGIRVVVLRGGDGNLEKSGEPDRQEGGAYLGFDGF